MGKRNRSVPGPEGLPGLPGDKKAKKMRKKQERNMEKADKKKLREEQNQAKREQLYVYFPNFNSDVASYCNAAVAIPREVFGSKFENQPGPKKDSADKELWDGIFQLKLQLSDTKPKKRVSTAALKRKPNKKDFMKEEEKEESD
ncbi:hypothetical protein AKO1_006644 [Acrasis kona]|uniref:Uncharacterized protein n=1 Tax=Acrasis kona TaxID=1008807 RepID=A0AAW2ZLE5_9EUKA